MRHKAGGCVEVLGGNQARTQTMVLAGLELLLVARPVGGHGGGDLYCLHSCGHRNFAKIVLLDVSGHGDRSALIANDIHRLLHEHSPDTSPAQLLDLVNRQFAHFAPQGILATSLCAVTPIGASCVTATGVSRRSCCGEHDRGNGRPWQLRGSRLAGSPSECRLQAAMRNRSFLFARATFC